MKDASMHNPVRDLVYDLVSDRVWDLVYDRVRDRVWDRVFEIGRAHV